ncbi:MAG: hypothetical protein ABWZ40_07980 [Caulobacterales bacterium]
MTNTALGYGSVFSGNVPYGDVLYDMLPSNWVLRSALLYGVSAILVCLVGASVLASAGGTISH